MYKKVFVLEASSGSYDDYRSWVVGIYTTKELAEKAKEKHDKENVIAESDLIMSQKEWSNLRYGYGDDGRTLVDKGRYTAEQFRIMGDQMDKLWEDNHPAYITEYELITE